MLRINWDIDQEIDIVFEIADYLAFLNDSTLSVHTPETQNKLTLPDGNK